MKAKKNSDWKLSLHRVVINHSEVRYTAGSHSVTARIDHCELMINSRTGIGGVPVIDATQGKIVAGLQGRHTPSGVTATAKVDADVMFSPRAGDPFTWRVTGAGRIHDIDILWPDNALRVACAKMIDT